jgi:hypothetical protein
MEPAPYDVFLSCSMASVRTEARYGEIRAQALAILEALEQECRFRVFFAGRDIASQAAFNEADFSVAQDIQALLGCRYFLLYYPEKVASSVLVEAGMALALKKKAVYFVRDRKHLPFILQKLEGVAPVRVCEFKTLDRVLNVIRNHRQDLFEPGVGERVPGAAPPAPTASGIRRRDEAADRLRELPPVVPDLAEDLLALEQLQVDVPSALNKIRYITEKVLHTVCVRGNVGWGQAEPTLERMLGPAVAGGLLPRSVAIHARTIQTNTSPGSHYQESALSESHAAIARQALAELLGWYAAWPDGRPPPRPG